MTNKLFEKHSLYNFSYNNGCISSSRITGII
nr:MAG TPA: hypothetical protein [Caudoviricetes sp.]